MRLRCPDRQKVAVNKTGRFFHTPVQNRSDIINCVRQKVCRNPAMLRYVAEGDFPAMVRIKSVSSQAQAKSAESGASENTFTSPGRIETMTRGLWSIRTKYWTATPLTSLRRGCMRSLTPALMGLLK